MRATVREEVRAVARAAVVPGVALQRRLFRKAGYNFAETYTFALLVCGLRVLAETAFIPLGRMGTPWYRIVLGLIEAA